MSKAKRVSKKCGNDFYNSLHLNDKTTLGEKVFPKIMEGREKRHHYSTIVRNVEGYTANDLKKLAMCDEFAYYKLCVRNRQQYHMRNHSKMPSSELGKPVGRKRMVYHGIGQNEIQPMRNPTHQTQPMKPMTLAELTFNGRSQPMPEFVEDLEDDDEEEEEEGEEIFKTPSPKRNSSSKFFSPPKKVKNKNLGWAAATSKCTEFEKETVGFRYVDMLPKVEFTRKTQMLTRVSRPMPLRMLQDTLESDQLSHLGLKVDELNRTGKLIFNEFEEFIPVGDTFEWGGAHIGRGDAVAKVVEQKGRDGNGNEIVTGRWKVYGMKAVEIIKEQEPEPEQEEEPL